MAANAASNADNREFAIHLAAYVGVNALLAAINLVTQPENLWFIWPLIGWGIGVAAHGLALYLKREAHGSGLLSNPQARGFVTHLFVYVAVNLLLAFINLRYSPGDIWFIWPLAGWGLLLFIHGLSIRPNRIAPVKAARAKPAAKRAAPVKTTRAKPTPKQAAAAKAAQAKPAAKQSAVSKASRAKPAAKQAAKAKAARAKPAAKQAAKAKAARAKPAAKQAAKAKAARAKPAAKQVAKGKAARAKPAAKARSRKKAKA